MSVAAPARAARSTWPRPRVDAASLAGRLGLAAVVVAAWCLALGAAGGSYLLHLPGDAHPAWVQGLLHHGAGIGPTGTSAALLVMFAGYAVALGCAPALTTRGALTAVVLANAAFVIGPTIVSSDVFGYIAYTREAALHGLNPYLSAPIAAPGDPILHYVYWKQEPSPYGPAFTVLSLPLGTVSIAGALWAYKVIAGIASVVLSVMVGGLARTRGIDAARAVVFVGVNPALLFYAVSGAHNDLLAAAVMTAAFALVLAGRPALGASAAVTAAAIKLTLGLALPFVVLAARPRRRALLGAGLALGVLGAASLVAFGPHLVDQIHRVASTRRFDIAFSGPDRLAAALGTPITGALRTICMGVALALAAVMIALAARGRDPLLAAGWAFLALIASIASLAPWYLVWLLPLAALARQRTLAIATVAASAYVIAVHLPVFGGHPWLSSPQRSASPPHQAGGSDSSSALSWRRSLVLARRIENATNGDAR
ncbi:MAG: glycosyltransferase 87 family protein [Solirubrobacteraceae bacterium]